MGHTVGLCPAASQLYPSTSQTIFTVFGCRDLSATERVLRVEDSAGYNT